MPHTFCAPSSRMRCISGAKFNSETHTVSPSHCGGTSCLVCECIWDAIYQCGSRLQSLYAQPEARNNSQLGCMRTPARARNTPHVPLVNWKILQHVYKIYKFTLVRKKRTLNAEQGQSCANSAAQDSSQKSFAGLTRAPLLPTRGARPSCLPSKEGTST